MVYEFRQVEFLILPKDIVHTFYLRDLAGFELGVASRHDENRIRVLATDTMNRLSVFMIGSIGHGAGVDDTDVRRFALFGTRMSSRYQGFAQRTRLCKIQLAA